MSSNLSTMTHLGYMKLFNIMMKIRFEIYIHINEQDRGHPVAQKHVQVCRPSFTLIPWKVKVSYQQETIPRIGYVSCFSLPDYRNTRIGETGHCDADKQKPIQTNIQRNTFTHTGTLTRQADRLIEKTHRHTGVHTQRDGGTHTTQVGILIWSIQSSSTMALAISCRGAGPWRSSERRSTDESCG